MRAQSIREAALALVWSRAVIWAAGLVAVAAYGLAPGWEVFDPQRVLGDGLALAPAARWDAAWFLAIAQDGYYGGSRPAFFPLYPMLIAGLGGSAWAGVAVSAVCALVALAVLHRLAELELGAAAAHGTVLAVAFFPTSFFLTAVYSESLFLALSAGAFLAARRERPALAGVLGALAAGTRSIGVLLVVPLWLLLSGRARAWVAVVPLGLVAYCAWLAIVRDDPWLPFQAQEVWHRTFAGPFLAVADVPGTIADSFAAGESRSHMLRRNLLDAAFLLFAVAGVAGALRRLPLAYGAWALVALAVPLSYPVDSQPLLSLPRFVLVLFPLHMWLATVAGPRALAASGALLGALSALFATWEFVA
jgi:hypothetical protein